MQNEAFPSFINYETANIRNYYENNNHQIQEKTPSSKKIQVFKSPFNHHNSSSYSNNIKKDLFLELIESDIKYKQRCYHENTAQLIHTSGNFEKNKCENLQTTLTKDNNKVNKILEIEFQSNKLHMDHSFSQLQTIEFDDSYETSEGKNGLFRKRKRKNNQQLQILKIEFEKNGSQVYWNKDRILKVAQKTGLSESQVYKWCWDQKQKKTDLYYKIIKNEGQTVNEDGLVPIQILNNKDCEQKPSGIYQDFDIFVDKKNINEKSNSSLQNKQISRNLRALQNKSNTINNDENYEKEGLQKNTSQNLSRRFGQIKNYNSFYK